MNGAIGGPSARPRIDGEKKDLKNHAMWRVSVLTGQKIRMYGIDFQGAMRSDSTTAYGGAMEMQAQTRKI